MKYEYILIILALVLVVVFLNGISYPEFLYIHDEFLVLTSSESKNLFYVLNQLDLGTPNTTILIVTLLSRIYYSIAYRLTDSIFLIQPILYFLQILISLFLPYWGFKKMYREFTTGNNDQDVRLLAISLFYSLNTYTLIYWHGNGFSLTLLFCYALAPLTFYAYYKSLLQEKRGWSYSILTAIFLFFMSLAFYLGAVFAFILILYTTIKLLLSLDRVKVVAINLLKLFLIFTPFLFFFTFVILDAKSFISASVNSSGGETYGALRGQMLYPALMWFSWAIYVLWEPRNIFTFHEYFIQLPSLLAPLAIFGLIWMGAIRQKRNVDFLIFLFILIIMIFFAKGAQPPLGNIYISLLENFPLFRVFRSPDNKFGFGVVFSLAMLLMFVAKSYKPKLFSIVLISVVLIQVYPLLSSVGIKGSNNKGSSDRVISISDNYSSLADFLNSESFDFGYVLPLPATEFGHFKISSTDKHIGSDLLPKIIEKPFVYTSIYSGMPSETLKLLTEALSKQDIKAISVFPIKYFLVRHDDLYEKIDENQLMLIQEDMELVFKNDVFELYKNNDAADLAKIAENNEIEYVSPIKLIYNMENINENAEISLNYNYNKNWKLYPVKINRTRTGLLSDLKYIYSKPIATDTHAINNGFSNKWIINVEHIKNDYGAEYYTRNQDNSINFKMVAYYSLQNVFYIGSFLTLIYILILILILVILRKNSHDN